MDGNEEGAGRITIQKNGIESLRNDSCVTPVQQIRLGRHGVMEFVDTPERECRPPTFHQWEEFVDGRWARDGNVLEGKQCIGRRNGSLCSREFVARQLPNKSHFSDTQYHPTGKHPVYGCRICP